MSDTRSDPFNFGEPRAGGVGADAMRTRIAGTLFGSDSGTVCVGRFELIEEIGSGGMGVVHRAYDPKLSRDVALKLVRTDRGDSSARARLLREARMLAQLNDPNVVTVFEADEHEGQVFVVMEFVAGTNARDWLASREPPIQDILRVYLQAGRGLLQAHLAGVVHRDFKPSNILLGDDGRARVADFGLADLGRAADTSDSGNPNPDPTRRGRRRPAGTPGYMAPEQWSGDTVGPPSDQFSYCVSLWEALVGVRPFNEEEVAGLVTAATAPVPRGQDRLDARIRRALLRGLAPLPRDRWPDMSGLLEAIEPRPPRRWPAVVVGASIMGIIGGGLLRANEGEGLCDTERERFAESWDATSRASLAAAFAKSSSFGEEGWVSVSQEMDRYHQRWTESAATVCQAQDSIGFACLRRGAAQWNEVVRAISSTDLSSAMNVHEALAGFVVPESCASGNVEHLMPVPVGDPVLQDEVAGARADLASVATMSALGRQKNARAALDTVKSVPAVETFGPLAAEVQCADAALEAREGNSKSASSRFGECLTRAQAEGHDLVVLQALTGLIQAGAWTDATDPRLAFWEGLAFATLSRIGEEPGSRRLLLEAVLEKDRQSGNWEDATERAAALLELSTSPERALWARQQHAKILFDSGDGEGARAAYEALLDEQRRVLGPRHPAVATSLLGLGRAFEEPREGEPYLREALALYTENFGKKSVKLARAATVLALNLALQGRLDEARPIAAEASETQLELQDRLDTERTSALSVLIHIEQSQVRYKQARSLLDRLVAELDPVEHRLRQARALNKAGILSLRLDEPERARTYFSRQLSMTSGDELMHLYALSGLGRAAAKVQQCSVAMTRLNTLESLLDSDVRVREKGLVERMNEVRDVCREFIGAVPR